MSNPSSFQILGVAQLCSSLGYSNVTKEHPRYHFRFRNLTARFRKDFLKQSPSDHDKIFDIDEAKARECALQFLAQHTYLFNDSEEARSAEWPIYPQDEGRILDLLTGLMHAQHQYFINNHKKIPESLDMEVEEESNQEEEDSLNEIDDDHPDMMSTSDIFEIHSHSARRREPAMLADSSESRDEARLEQIRQSAIHHLKFVYPPQGRDSQPTFPPGERHRWLFEANALFPPYGRAIIARGQHEFNVYSTAGQHSQLRKFIQNLKKSLNITSTTAAEEKVIYKRVKRRICYHVEMWTKAGYLTGDRNHKSKTTMFDSLWRDQRSLWIQERDSGVQSNEDVEEGAAGGSIPPRSNERPSSNGTTGPRVGGPVVGGEDESSNTASAVSNLSNSMPEESPSDNTVAVQKETDAPSSNVQNASDGNTTPAIRASVASMREEPVTVLLTSQRLSNGAGPSSVNSSLPSSLPLVTRRSKPKTKKPELYIVLGDWEFGDANPFPAKEVFFNIPLKDFFIFVCDRVERPVDSVPHLTLRYNWKPDLPPIVVDASIGEEAWLDIKERVQDRFNMDRMSMQGRTRFRVWVTCPEMEDDD